MKKSSGWLIGISLATALLLPQASGERPEQPSEHVGVYDSRVIAYVQFWTDASRQQRDRETADAKLAEESGHRAMASRLSSELAADQARIHLEVFSTAPANEALAALKDRLPALCSSWGVTRLVSKWDDEALKQVPAACRVDVTNALVRQFFAHPNAKLEATIKSIEQAKPVPVTEARALTLISVM